MLKRVGGGREKTFISTKRPTGSSLTHEIDAQVKSSITLACLGPVTEPRDAVGADTIQVRAVSAPVSIRSRLHDTEMIERIRHCRCGVSLGSMRVLVAGGPVRPCGGASLPSLHLSTPSGKLLTLFQAVTFFLTGNIPVFWCSSPFSVILSCLCLICTS